MRKIFVTMSMVALLFGACKNATQKAQEGAEQAMDAAENMVETTMNDAKKAIEESLVVGTYQGVTPCASCEGIQLELKLNANLTYELTQTYLGEKNATPETFKGNFSLDKDIIKLDGIKDMSNLFKLEQNQVRLLSADGSEVTGELADSYVLKRK